ncbi:MAG TPA: hypothetical protein VJ697_16600 [Nitrososphaeraceae archaeon]|jgi:hypothetical protein|nr:hypothetical protein [Nitrososphaeraceae archaeon]
MESNYKKLICAISVIAIIVVIIQLNGLYGLVTENRAINFTRNNNSDIEDSEERFQKIPNDTLRQIELSFY